MYPEIELLVIRIDVARRIHRDHCRHVLWRINRVVRDVVRDMLDLSRIIWNGR